MGNTTLMEHINAVQMTLETIPCGPISAAGIALLRGRNVVGFTHIESHDNWSQIAEDFATTRKADEEIREGSFCKYGCCFIPAPPFTVNG